MRRLLACLTAATLSLGLLAGCGTYQNTAAPTVAPAPSGAQPTQTAGTAGADFTMIYNGVVTLNPILSQSSNDHNVFYLTQLELVRYYGDEILFDGAASCDISDDSTVYTLHLREGLKWSDGVALTARDFEYSFRCLLDPAMGSPSGYGWYAIKNAEAFGSGAVTDWAQVGVKALDDLTLEITLERPIGSFLETIACLGLYPLRQDFVEQVGDKLGSSVDTMLYSGPYTIESWVLDSTMELKKNELYWDSANSFPTPNIHFVEVADANTKVAMFENGEVDAVEQISSQYYDYLNDYLYNMSGGGFMFLWFNQKGMNEDAGKLLSNRNFRQALSYGFDRQATVAAVDRANVPVNRLVDPNFVGPNGGKFVDEYPATSVPLTGDVTKAKEYLAKAMEELGYTDVSQLPQLQLVTWDTPTQKTLLETVIDQWKQNLGLGNVQLNQYVIGTAIGSFYDLSYDIFCITWETDVLPTDIMRAMATGGEVNYGIWSNAEYDALVAQAVTELDPEKQAQLTAQAEQIFLDEAPVVPIFSNGSAHAVQSYVSGFQMSGTSSGYQFNHLTVTK